MIIEVLTRFVAVLKYFSMFTHSFACLFACLPVWVALTLVRRQKVIPLMVAVFFSVHAWSFFITFDVLLKKSTDKNDVDAI